MLLWIYCRYNVHTYWVTPSIFILYQYENTDFVVYQPYTLKALNSAHGSKRTTIKIIELLLLSNQYCSGIVAWHDTNPL